MHRSMFIDFMLLLKINEYNMLLLDFSIKKQVSFFVMSTAVKCL